MIRLYKLPKPPVLAANEDQWTNDYLGHSPPIPDSVRFRYRRPEINATIRAETHDKCAYCESRMRHVDSGEVDHLLPVSTRPQLIYQWENLTFVCHQCNSAKRNYDDPDHPLIHPYDDNPEDHILFVGPMAVNEPTSLLGQRSIRRLKLNRPALLEERKEQLQRLQDLINTWAALPDNSDKQLCHQEIVTFAESDSEYAAAARFFLRFHGLLSE